MAEHLEAVVQKRMAWFGSLSEEDQGKVRADKQMDEEAKQARQQEMQATFTTADTNSDGLLDKAEFTNFMKMMSQNAQARGVPSMSEDDVADADKEAIWGLFNGQTADVDGVSPLDVVASMMMVAERTKALQQS